jgi:ubiquitin C-terminal hydrolase
MSIEPFGIDNLGNTCFFNSLFQLLLCSDTFVEYNLKFGKDSSILRIILHRINNKHFDYNLYKALIYKCLNKFGGQECSDEYFMTIVNALAPKVQNIFKITTNNTKKCNKCDYTNEEHLTEFQLFYVDMFTSMFQCKCGGTITQKIIYEKTSDLIYMILDETKNVNLQEVMQINNTSYNLLGCVIHHGTQNGGHYIAQGKRNGKIYTFNDSSVSPSGYSGDRKRIALYMR